MIRKKRPTDPWINISDLMSGLMIVFLLISISYMENVQKSNVSLQRQRDGIRKIVVAYETTQIDLYNRLMQEFKKDLPKWGAAIQKETLSVIFLEPDILFRTGEAEISSRFRTILNDFFPRYISLLSSDEFRDTIDEIRIEGHTSSEWTHAMQDSAESYFLNMELSQRRTLSVLQYCYTIMDDSRKQEFIRKYVTANGLSSSRLIVDAAGNEDRQRSRRVEFRTRTSAEKEILRILDELNAF